MVPRSFTRPEHDTRALDFVKDPRPLGLKVSIRPMLPTHAYAFATGSFNETLFVYRFTSLYIVLQLLALFHAPIYKRYRKTRTVAAQPVPPAPSSRRVTFEGVTLLQEASNVRRSHDRRPLKCRASGADVCF